MRKPDLPPASLEPAEAVLKFLASIGSSADAELYLRLFRSRAPEGFATLAVEAAALEHDADGVALDLRFLHALDLTPVVVLGMDADEPQAAATHRQDLAELLRRSGLQSLLHTTAGPYDQVVAAARAGVIPLLLASGADHGSRLESLAHTLAALRTHKLIFLGPLGGLRLHGKPLNMVNLNTDYESLEQELLLQPHQRRLLEDSRRLILELVPHRILVSLTSPLNLLHELFTVKGAGTLLRKGVAIRRHDGYAGVDLPRLRALLASSFGKAPSEALWSRPLEHAYIEEGYRGAALLHRTELGGYLSKFAVTREAQGEGIGQDLWSALCTDYAALLWRARRDNPIRPWYERNCQGRFETDGWSVYFRGLRPEQLPQAIALALSQPLDF